MKNDLSRNQRGAILADSPNIFMASLAMGVKVDYGKILQRLNGREMVRCILYHVEIDPARETGFLKKIRSLGFEVKTKQLRTYPNGKAKADMDVDLTIDAVALAEKCDVITLLTGDGDFCPLISYLKAKGVKTEAMAFECNASGDLRRTVDEFFPITEDMFLQNEQDR